MKGQCSSEGDDRPLGGRVVDQRGVSLVRIDGSCVDNVTAFGHVLQSVAAHISQQQIMSVGISAIYSETELEVYRRARTVVDCKRHEERVFAMLPFGASPSHEHVGKYVGAEGALHLAGIDVLEILTHVLLGAVVD